jgi:hypothetical protein
MIYNVNALNSAADCDTLIAQVNLEKGNMMLKKNALEQEQANLGPGGNDIPTAIAFVNAQIEQHENFIPGMPAGNEKTAAETSLLRLKLRLSLLQKRASEYGVFAQLDRSFDIAKYEAQISEAGNFIQALEERKAQIEQQANNAA